MDMKLLFENLLDFRAEQKWILVKKSATSLKNLLVIDSHQKITERGAIWLVFHAVQNWNRLTKIGGKKSRAKKKIYILYLEKNLKQLNEDRRLFDSVIHEADHP